MDLSRKWTAFALEAEIDAYGASRIAAYHNALSDRCSDLEAKLVDAGALHLADESTIFQLEKQKLELVALLREAREDLFHLGQNSSIDYEHGELASSRRNDAAANAIHSRIDEAISRVKGEQINAAQGTGSEKPHAVNVPAVTGSVDASPVAAPSSALDDALRELRDISTWSYAIPKRQLLKLRLADADRILRAHDARLREEIGRRDYDQ